MVSAAIKPAIRGALRLHEIGNDTPYKISFAAKGKSGASFGFMQGDLAAAQPFVTATFRNAMSAAGMTAADIDGLLAQLSKHQIKNPLSAAETSRVNRALLSAANLVDRMDEQILAHVYDDLDRCLDRATQAHRRVDTKAQIYMMLWINMSGPPTKLLVWLGGGDPELPREVAAAREIVTGEAMEDYLAATNYYVSNPQNLNHLHQCADAGMRALDEATSHAVPIAQSTEFDASAAPLAVAFSTAAHGPAGAASEVTVSAKSDTGRDVTVAIRKTGADSGNLSLREATDGTTQSFSVTAIRARADGTRLVCQAQVAFFSTMVSCTLQAARTTGSDTIVIAASGPFPFTRTYSATRPDFDRLKDFIAQAGFPALDPLPSQAFAATAMPAIAASNTASDDDPYHPAIVAIEIWKLQPSSPAYDDRIAPLVRAASSRIKADTNPADLAKWLELQSSAMNISDSDILSTTLTLREVSANAFSQALQSLSTAQQLRVRLALGEIDPPDQEAVAVTAAALPPTAAVQVLGAFTGQSIFTSPRHHPVVHGELKLFDNRGAALGTYTVNTGGGARNYKTTNGPVPPGFYRLSHFRPRDTVGMVFNGIGYSFDLDPILDTKVFGRSLFRVHPDGGQAQTNGCLGVREDAGHLIQCRDQLRHLLDRGPVTISVSYEGLSI